MRISGRVRVRAYVLKDSDQNRNENLLFSRAKEHQRYLIPPPTKFCNTNLLISNSNKLRCQTQSQPIFQTPLLKHTHTPSLSLICTCAQGVIRGDGIKRKRRAHLAPAEWSCSTGLNSGSSCLAELRGHPVLKDLRRQRQPRISFHLGCGENPRRRTLEGSSVLESNKHPGTTLQVKSINTELI